jgi:flagellar basal body-associated protein FliL
MSINMTTSLIASITSLISNVFAYVTKKLSLNNADDMKANAAAKTTQEIKDEAVATVSEADLEEVRKGVAE